jgi:hypothetical protein
MTYNKDGSVVGRPTESGDQYQLPANGKAAHFVDNYGNDVVQLPDGSSNVYYRDGSILRLEPDGITTHQLMPPGYGDHIVVGANGATDVYYADGAVLHIGADGHTMSWGLPPRR